MFSIIDKNRFFQLGIGMFGVFSVYVIHSIIYERLIMVPFQNLITQKKQYFNSQAGFIFLQKTIAWILTQILAFCVLKKQSKTKIPQKYTLASGFFVFLSSILFTTGIFELNFRLSISNHTSTYLIVTLIGCVISPYTSSSRSPKFRDIFSGLGIGLGVILFWMCGEDFWVYTPTKNGYIYNWLVISSGICDGILALIQARICEKYQPNEIQLLLNVSRWTAFWCFIYAFMVGDLRTTFDFCYFHQDWTLCVIAVAVLYFMGQLFIYRVTTRMAQNVPAFITTSRKVLTIHQSYIFSSHKIHMKQVFGMAISWISILVQAILFVKKQNTQAEMFQKVPRYQFQMGQISAEHINVEKH